MKKLLSGTFKQVEDALSESFVSYCLHTVKSFKGWKVFLFILLFMGAAYFIYGMGWGIVTSNNNELTVPLDPNNEYRFFFSNVRFLWYTHIIAFLVVLTVIMTLKYRGQHNIKCSLIYHFTSFLFYVTSVTLGFAFLQSFVNNSVPRTIYTILFIVCIIYPFVKGDKNAFAMIYEDKKQRSAIIEWASKHRQAILSVLSAFGGVNYFFKT